MRTIILKMSEKEFEAFFAMAEENAIEIGTTEDEHAIPNIKRVETINKMLRYNRRREQINF